MNKDLETNSELKKLQIELTDLALKLADIAKVKLDFSIKSIEEVEKILFQIHEQYKKTKDEEGIGGMALELAAHIVTVIEKNISIGKWERNSEEFGEETFPYTIREGNIISPYAWCLKPITEGESENVLVKFQTLVLEKTER